MMQKLYINARKIHRVLVIVVLISGLTMSTTGMIIKFPEIFGPYLSLYSARQIHNIISSIFGPLFIIMALTGLVMFTYPYILKWKQKKKAS